jgi:hypothetical protein
MAADTPYLHTWRRIIVRIISAITASFVAAALLGGCAAPAIDTTQFKRPKTVAIVDFPDAKPGAIIGFVNVKWPQAYFLGPADPYFVAAGGQFGAPPVAGNGLIGEAVGTVAGRQAAGGSDANRTGGAIAGAAVGSAVAGFIYDGAEATQKKAEGYAAEVKTAMPGLDIRTEVLGALRKSLEAKGIAVSILDDSRKLAPRLRWPATDKDGKPIETGELANSPPIEADVVAQVVPLALYASPGPLNNYNSAVGIGLALYDGRTRKFLGWQAFQSDQNKLWYARYDSLVADIRQAAPAQHAALVSLVPQVSDAISGGK